MEPKMGGGVFTTSIHSKNCLAFFGSKQLHLPKRTDEATLVLHIPFENKVFLGPPKNSLRNPLAVLGFSSMKGLTKIKKTALLRKKNQNTKCGPPFHDSVDWKRHPSLHLRSNQQDGPEGTPKTTGATRVPNSNGGSDHHQNSGVCFFVG